MYRHTISSLSKQCLIFMFTRIPPYRGFQLALWLSLSLIGLSSTGVWADEAPALPFKFTTGWYDLSGGDQQSAKGLDLHLRHSSSLGNAWLGWYQQGASGNADQADYSPRVQQSRAGWDNSFQFSTLRLQPSLQIADGGFVGGSFNLETGQSWYAGAGLGRTNLQPYVNLNFDPNDALMLSAGYRGSDRAPSVGLQWVRDNRLNPDQRHLHLVYRQRISSHERITIDLLDKVGTVEDEYIHKLGWSAAYDWRQYFVHVAYDPKANFGPQDMWRLSLGTHF
jgi:hypothetical protein